MAFHYFRLLARSSLRSCHPVKDRHCHWLLMRGRDRDCISVTPRGSSGCVKSAAEESRPVLQSSSIKFSSLLSSNGAFISQEWQAKVDSLGTRRWL